MRITEGQLRRLIRQEVRALRENMGTGPDRRWFDDIMRSMSDSAPEGSSYGNPAQDGTDEVSRISDAVNSVHDMYPELDSADVWLDLYDNAEAYRLNRDQVDFAASKEYGLGGVKGPLPGDIEKLRTGY